MTANLLRPRNAPNAPAINPRVNDPIIRLLGRDFMVQTQFRDACPKKPAPSVIVRTKPAQRYCPYRCKEARKMPEHASITRGLSSRRPKWLGTVLAGQRIFHIGNVIDVPTVP